MTTPSVRAVPTRAGGAGRYAAAMADSTDGLALQDPSYRRGIVDLLGVLSYGELTAFDRLAEDAKLAPNTRDKARLASMAAKV